MHCYIGADIYNSVCIVYSKMNEVAAEEERVPYVSEKDKKLQEEKEKERLAEIRAEELSKKIDWNDIDREVIQDVDNYSGEDCRILLKESLWRLGTAKDSLKSAKESADFWEDITNTLRKKFKICELCDTNESTKRFSNTSRYYCKRHMKDTIRLNEKFGSLANDVFEKVMSGNGTGKK